MEDVVNAPAYEKARRAGTDVWRRYSIAERIFLVSGLAAVFAIGFIIILVFLFSSWLDRRKGIQQFAIEDTWVLFVGRGTAGIAAHWFLRNVAFLLFFVLVDPALLMFPFLIGVSVSTVTVSRSTRKQAVRLLWVTRENWDEVVRRHARGEDTREFAKERAEANRLRFKEDHG